MLDSTATSLDGSTSPDCKDTEESFCLGDAKGGSTSSPFEPIAPLAHDYSLLVYGSNLYGWDAESVWQLVGSRVQPRLALLPGLQHDEIRIADLNADGNLEIISYGDFSATVWAGHDQLQQRATVDFLTLSSEAVPFTLGDLDGDGLIDLIALDKTHLRWFKADSALEFSEQATDTGVQDANARATWIEVDDVDHDGDLDLVAMYRGGDVGSSAPSPSLISAYLNTGSATTFTRVDTALGAADTRITARPFVDVDGDAAADVVWVSANRLWFSANQGEGHFAEPVRADDGANELSGVTRLTSVDLDLDGEQDLLIERNRGAALQLLNRGAGQFRTLDLDGNRGEARHVAAGVVKGETEGVASVRIFASLFTRSSAGNVDGGAGTALPVE